MEVKTPRALRRDMQNMAKKQKRLLENRQKEIEQIKTDLDGEKTYLRVEHYKNIDDIRDQNRSEINDLILKKEEKLDHIQNEMKNTQDFLKSEEESLIVNHRDQMDKVKLSLNERLIENQDRSQETIENHLDYSRDRVQEQRLHAHNEIIKSKYATDLQVNKAHQDNSQLVRGLTSEQKKQVSRLESDQRSEQKRLVLEHKKNLLEQQSNQSREAQTKAQIHQDEMSFAANHRETILKQEQTRFESKYKALVDEHEVVLDRLKKTFESEINQHKEIHKDELRSKKVREDDDFYSEGDIAPKIKEFGSHYDISMKVPEHEKDMYNISGDKRKIILSFSRKHFDDVRSDDSVLTTRRTESLTKTFNVGEIIDPNIVKKTYDNGILTFKLAKA